MFEQACRLSHLSVCWSVCLSGGWIVKRTADWLWMPFAVLIGVGRAMGVLGGGLRTPRGRRGLGFFLYHWFELRFECMFKTEMYSAHAWNVCNISVRTIYWWNRYLFFFLKMYFVPRSTLAFTRNMLKCNSDFTTKSRIAATLTQG